MWFDHKNNEYFTLVFYQTVKKNIYPSIIHKSMLCFTLSHAKKYYIFYFKSLHFSKEFENVNFQNFFLN